MKLISLSVIGILSVKAAIDPTATTMEATTAEATTKESTTEEATTKEATTLEATTAEATTKEDTTAEATTKESTTEEATTKEATTLEATTKEATTVEATTMMDTTFTTTSITSANNSGELSLFELLKSLKLAFTNNRLKGRPHLEIKWTKITNKWFKRYTQMTAAQCKFDGRNIDITISDKNNTCQVSF